MNSCSLLLIHLFMKKKVFSFVFLAIDKLFYDVFSFDQSAVFS